MKTKNIKKLQTIGLDTSCLMVFTDLIFFSDSFNEKGD